MQNLPYYSLVSDSHTKPSGPTFSSDINQQHNQVNTR